MEISFVLNGKPITVDTSPLRRVVDLFREELELVTVKEGCGEGECGTCSIIMNGELVNSCLLPAVQLQGSEVITTEGIRDTVKGNCIIDAFISEGSVQCGFCFPGMLVATEALLSKNAKPTEREVREELSGNLCRCTGYDMIVNGVLKAAKNGEGLW